MSSEAAASAAVRNAVSYASRDETAQRVANSKGRELCDVAAAVAAATVAVGVRTSSRFVWWAKKAKSEADDDRNHGRL